MSDQPRLPAEPCLAPPTMARNRTLGGAEEAQAVAAGRGGGRVNVLMIGTGEYTTGYVGGAAADSDKGAGVVALVMFDLRSRGVVGRVGMCGTNGAKFPGIRAHMQRCIGDVYDGLSLECETWPADGVRDGEAYKTAVASFQPGDVAIIFTPDDTHFTIAMECVRRGMHVLVTKPAVKTLAEHTELAAAADAAGVLVCVEVHKRFDPIYQDAYDRIQGLGDFSYLYAYMSQPKHQLETFKAWAGKSSDISYYLNSHHVDFNEWVCGEKAVPVCVTATGSTGVANAALDVETEDSITLTVQWRNLESGNLGTAVYTSAWIAPRADVHSQQRFFYMGTKGEINVDQAHRGYTMAKDGNPFGSVNPLFMKYTPTRGKFSGQRGYGYRSFEVFVDACNEINTQGAPVRGFDESLPTIHATYLTTTILEAGRLSLDADSRPMVITYKGATGADAHMPVSITPKEF
uniref:Gfo/Idh/MocA-like oxidoreductase N-terminal domain-containing protein n=1 Tax=Phaeomonas parva TaxID=124430 RepID=A0A7S1XWL6_9STRA|mmetsp:Transcript_39305/g.123070  ORF Transcript_39305/g.123070 Transcript_39305/m.123070 type:complete len:460 (+) Transcript_39305:217-1596(+)